MKKILIILLYIILVQPLLCEEPKIKVFFTSINFQEFNISEIENLNFIQSNLSYSMIIFTNYNKAEFDLRLIDSIIFIDNNQIQVFQNTIIQHFLLYEIDSIIFRLNECEVTKIGNQVWACQNLDVDRYRNGEPLRRAESIEEWKDANNRKEGAWCYYNNDSTMGAKYGKLYNWYAVSDPRGLAPLGWHIPSDNEWKVMEIFLGMNQTDANKTGLRGTNEGGKLKTTGNKQDKNGSWNSPNEGATNETGFSGLPAGNRDYNGNFYLEGDYGTYWTSTMYYIEAWYRNLSYNYPNIHRSNSSFDMGFSIRCMKDN